MKNARKGGLNSNHPKKHEAIKQELKRFREIKLKTMQTSNTTVCLSKTDNSNFNERKKKIENLSNLLSPSNFFLLLFSLLKMFQILLKISAI